MDEQTPKAGRRRRQPTHPKRIYLTESGEEQIQTWAEENGVNFSAANEALAALGTDHPQEALVRTVNDILSQELVGLKQALREVQAGLERIEAQQASLANRLKEQQEAVEKLHAPIAHTAISSAMTRRWVESLVQELIRQTAAAHPDDFAEILNISEEDRRGRRILEYFDQAQKVVRGDAAQELLPQAAWAVHLLLSSAGRKRPGAAGHGGEGEGN